MIVDRFSMNGDIWEVRFVSQNDRRLVDRTNTLTVATTDPKTKNIYLSEILRGDFLMKVFIHELGHCALYSFGLLDEIHHMTYPEYWVPMEEFICNFLADYGWKVFRIAYSKRGYGAWKEVPSAFQKLIA